MLIYHKELPAADRAVEDARKAGKAAQCPAEFQEAAALRDQAYIVYWSCRTNEAIALANQAIAKANALCPVKAMPAPPPPPPAPAPPPPPPSPTVNLSADPSSIQRGACSTLTWSSTNASSASIDPGVGNVPTSGSRQVCPTSSTDYQIVATGAGGSARASTSVTVTAPPPPPPAPKVIDKLTLHVNFDFDKAVIRNADVPELQKAVDFLKKYPNAKISIEGHTDDRGTVPYNLKLSERRAIAVKDWLIARGATDAAHAQTVGHGKANPIASNATPEGRFQNRRVEILILSQ
jgi:outer membrane protein OmpA-like peptidoglycan-associated protein